MMIVKPTKAAAETLANNAHNWLIANNPAYAYSVSIGQTVRWSNVDPVDGGYGFLVEPKMFDSLSGAERLEALAKWSGE